MNECARLRDIRCLNDFAPGRMLMTAVRTSLGLGKVQSCQRAQVDAAGTALEYLFLPLKCKITEACRPIY